jgi:hypothetical protein
LRDVRIHGGCPELLEERGRHQLYQYWLEALEEFDVEVGF